MQILLCMSFMAIAQLGHAELDTPVPSDIGNNNKGDNLINSVNQFGFKLLTKLMKQYPDENIVISPASISCLLAMALLGCVGRSYDELAKALGFSEDILINRQNHELFGELLKQLNSNDSWTKTMLTDVVFVDHRTQLREAYRTYLDKVYNGEILNVDFTDEVRVKEFINKWVSEQTNGKIDNFLKESLPINTKVVLLSALYFSGQWAKPFIPEYTKQLPFTNGKENIVADLMLNLGQFSYVFAVKDGLHMIALPYNDSLNTMYVLKPRRPENLTLPTLMENLDVTKIDTIINQMTKQDVVIRFPKMEIKKDFNLQTALKELGVRSIFDPRESNFALMIDTNIARNVTEDELLSNINGSQAEEKSLNNLLNSLMNPGVYVDSVMHEVKIKINEYGTEAVAATSGTLARSSEVFYADTPFFMFIRNEKTKMITFSAVVYNPSV